MITLHAGGTKNILYEDSMRRSKNKKDVMVWQIEMCNGMKENVVPGWKCSQLKIQGLFVGCAAINKK